jgi:V/A-type H+-transporting ATPase subunit B
MDPKLTAKEVFRMLENAANVYGLIHEGVKEIKGPLVFVEKVSGVGYDETVKIRDSEGNEKLGRVVDVSKDLTVIQVLGDTTGLQTDCLVNFTGSAFKIAVSNEALGRIFNGKFEPIDGSPPILSDDRRNINGAPINPKARVFPDDFIQTGISCIDGLFSLIRGQKLPIFSDSGLPHNRLIAQILRQATVLGKEEEVAIVFAAMGLKNDEARFFISRLTDSGMMGRSILILNLANDPTVERLLTPRIALTIAEYLAFDMGMHVLAILSDMTNYAEALRELSAAVEEVPSKAGYPGYLYSDLASIYERAGVIEGVKGSLTQLPVLTMPGGDLHHPVPDLTGYITEGQIYLDRDLDSRGIYPPASILPSLSRLMRNGIGTGKTRDDHKDVADQVYDAYAKGTRARDLAKIVGEVGLSENETKYLEFTETFEKQFVNQGDQENRPIEKTLDLAWSMLSILPEKELVRIDEKYIEKYHPVHRK